MQYYNTMIVPGEVSESIIDGNGNIQPQAPSQSYTQECRYEPSDRVKEITTADGITISYQGIIYMPVTATRIKDNLTIEVVGEIKANTKYFKRGLLNCKLYI